MERKRACGALAGVLVFAISASSACAPAADRKTSVPEEKTCDFGAYIIDPDPKGTNVRDAPRGRIIRTIPHSENKSAYVRVTGYHVRSSGDTWLHVRFDDGTTGWMYHELVGIWIKSTESDDETTLHRLPDASSPVTGTIFGEGEATVLGGFGKWAIVRYVAGDGIQFNGWLAPERQCARPVQGCR